MQLKKTVLIGLVLALTLTSYHAWAGGGGQSGGSSAPAPAAGGQIVKPTKITWMADMMVGEEDGQKEFLDKYKEMTGIEIELIKPAHNQYMEKVDLAFATGDAPDVVYMDANMTRRYGNAGALYDISELFKANKNCQYFNMGVIDAMRVNGKLYGLPMALGNGTVTYIRADWLQEAGLQQPKTYDEFINVLRAFKKLYPNKIPYTAPGIIQSEYPLLIYTVEFFQDANPDYVKVNGKWVDGIQQPNMRAALERFRSAYAEGLIDRDLLTNNTSAARDKVMSDNVGVFNYWAGPWNDNLNVGLKKTNPKGNLVPLPAIKGVTYFDRVAVGSVITKNSKNPAGVFEYFLAWMYDHGPGQTLFTHGVEGIHYEMRGSELFHLPARSTGNIPTSGQYLKPDLNTNNWTADPYKLPAAIIPSMQIFNATAVVAPLTPASEIYDQNDADVLIARKTFLADVVYGNKTFDAALAAYKASAGRLVDQVLADFNK